MTENKRDLSEDLQICDAASEGPWWYEELNPDHCGKYVNIHRVIMDFGYSPDIDDQSACGGFPPCAEDERFIAEARTGWPHAIQRAITAETEVERLRQVLRSIADKDGLYYLSAQHALGDVLRIAKEALRHGQTEA